MSKTTRMRIFNFNREHWEKSDIWRFPLFFLVCCLISIVLGIGVGLLFR